MKEICGECSGTFDGEECWKGDYWVCPHCGTALGPNEMTDDVQPEKDSDE